MPFTGGDVQRNLPTKGFQEDRSGDHIYFYFWKDGKKTQFYTKVSHGSKKEIMGDNLVKLMKRQLGLDTLAQVRALVECTMDQAQYVSTLQDANRLPR